MTARWESELPADLAVRVALVTLSRVGPVRARWLLSGDGPAAKVIDDLRSGQLPTGIGPAPVGVTPELVDEWATKLRGLDPAQLLAYAFEVAPYVLRPDDVLWPFPDDPDPPAVVFATTDVWLLRTELPMVAIVGTRRCTALGRRVAFDLGADLARAGVGVVSGLASGIDAAAHKGVLSAGGWAIGVVATGLDTVYPKGNTDLWAKVADEGVMLSEAPPGTHPERWRFPARNRLIASLADVVVVVESHAQGGSLITAAEAADRGVPVMAVPGSIASPASVGSNQLLADGCAPVCGVADILDLLGQPAQPTLRFSPEPPAMATTTVAEQQLAPLSRTILAQVEAGACHVDELLGACRATIPELLAEVSRLQSLGLVELDGSTVSIGAEHRHS